MTFFARFASMLIVLVGCAWSVTAEADIGCWAASHPGPPTCEPITRPCNAGSDCGGSRMCVDGFCADGIPRVVCSPCVPAATLCPPTFDGGALSEARSGSGRCVYTYLCGAERQIQALELPVTSLCFLRPGGGMPVLWQDGDCDGDGMPNGREAFACVTLVKRGVPTTPESTLTQLVDGAFETCSSPTSHEVAPGRCVTDGILGVACQSGSCMGSGRCVHTTDADGICTYSDVSETYDRRAREDRSCVDAGSARGWPESSLALTCNRVVGGAAAAWPQGDCDLDGIPNNADAHVCEQLALVRRAARGLFFESSPGTVLACGDGGRSVLPSDLACAGSTDAVSFGVACASLADCPVVPDNFGRCVLLPTVTDAVLGVCLYDPEANGDDGSCLSHPPTGCFNTGGDYDFVASDDCDGTSPANAADREVCSISLDAGPGLDAGLDAGADAPTLDAASLEDVGAVDAAGDALSMSDARGAADASGPPVTFGGGGGCVCSTHSGGSRYGGLAALVVALGVIRRRRRLQKIC